MRGFCYWCWFFWELKEIKNYALLPLFEKIKEQNWQLQSPEAEWHVTRKMRSDGDKRATMGRIDNCGDLTIFNF